VRRRRDPADERQVRIGLTEAGNRLRQSALGKSVVSEAKLTPEQAMQLHETLVNVRASLLDAARKHEKK
jgi:DNA-binding MarR family transcriptional regulator